MKSFSVRSLITVAVAAATIVVAHAQTLNVNFIGSGRNDNYKIELFEAGAAYPSRQAYVNVTNQITFSWYNLTTMRYSWGYKAVEYFIRVTNSKGYSYQTHSFDIIRKNGVAGIKLLWGVDYLGN